MSWDPGGMSWYGRQSVRAEQPTSRETSGAVQRTVNDEASELEHALE